MKRTKTSLQEPGAFVVGCNYWASHAGTAMWTDWRPKVVEKDLRELAAAGLQVLRVFPLWPAFQPIHLLRGGHGRPQEFRHGEAPLPNDAAGRAGVSPEAIERFAHFAAMCRKHDLRLIVGLVTGWMSGRYFAPPALDGLNPITDPKAILWEVRFVKYFVERFKDEPAVLAWDLGNECNCMGPATREQAWTWTASIVHAIRSVDRTRPVVSGMHGMKCDSDSPDGWTISDQAELNDVLTTHPYPIFTPHCDQDPLPTMRTLLHATAESRLYADLGGKPCLVEEVGTLGPMIADEKVAASFVRANLFSCWAHDCHGFLWWCGYDQAHLEHAPYDWNAVERELGLFRAHGKAKPVLRELSRFRRFLDGLPFGKLPPRLTDAVCILSAGQDHWGAAFAAFILAKQAGLDIEFQYHNQPLKPSPVYLLPSVSGGSSLARREWLALMERVREGATLYMSLNNALLSPFEEITGLRVVTRERRAAPGKITFEGEDLSLPIGAGAFRLALEATRAQVLAREADGNPAFACATLGKGRVYLITAPIEMELTQRPGSVYGPNAIPYWRVYRRVFDFVRSARIVAQSTPHIGVTEHPLDAKKRVVIAINYSPEPVVEKFGLNHTYHLGQVHHGKAAFVDAEVECRLAANDAAVFTVARR